jgi:hypothetical protein
MRCFFDADAFHSMLLTDYPQAASQPGAPIASEVWYQRAASKAASQAASSEEWYQSQRARAATTRWTTKGLQHEDDDTAGGGDPEAGCEGNGDGASACDAGGGSAEVNQCMLQRASKGAAKVAPGEVGDAAAAKTLLSRTRLVCGLHPDQAAGEIAAFADRLGLPWCIVPCCVYSKTFTKRRLQDGTHVKSHSQLIKWLCENYPRARVATLDFEGKNQVVYCLPTSN